MPSFLALLFPKFVCSFLPTSLQNGLALPITTHQCPSPLFFRGIPPAIPVDSDHFLRPPYDLIPHDLTSLTCTPPPRPPIPQMDTTRRPPNPPLLLVHVQTPHALPKSSPSENPRHRAPLLRSASTISPLLRSYRRSGLAFPSEPNSLPAPKCTGGVRT